MHFLPWHICILLAPHHTSLLVVCQWKFNEKVGFYSAWKLFIALCSLEQILIGLIPWHWEKVRFQMGIGRLCDSEDFFFCPLCPWGSQVSTQNKKPTWGQELRLRLGWSVFHEHCRSLSDVLSSSVPDSWKQRCWNFTCMRIVIKFMMR